MSDPRRLRGSSLRSRNNAAENQHQQTRGIHNSGRSKMSKYQRQTSYDRVRKIVQEEGREARNLITWNVPVDGSQQERRKGATGSAGQGDSADSPNLKGYQRRKDGQVAAHAKNPSESESAPKSARPRDLPVAADFSRVQGSKPDPELLNSSHNTTNGGAKKGDLRARYWAFLFDNLKRAVDEIYQTCETDESEVECKEVLMMLEQCTKDFKSLIERLQLLKAFESADEKNKPTSLAWEVRKSSPGKGLSVTDRGKDFVPSPTVVRSLNFNLPAQTPKLPLGNSWADRVKGNVPKAPVLPAGDNLGNSIRQAPLPTEGNILLPHTSTPGNAEDDLEGWETVQRNSRTKRPLSAGNRTNNIKQLQDTSNNNIANSQYTRSASVDPVITAPDSKPSLDDPLRKQPNSDPNLSAGRRRTSSHDSEKENQPMGDQDIINAPQNESGVSEDRECGTAVLDPCIVDHGPVVAHDTFPDPTASGALFDDNKEAAQDPLESIEDITDDEDEEEKFNSALASVLDEEDHYSTELEKAQDAALESAIQEEQSYLKEIAREQSRELDIETETESDLGNTASSTGLEASLQQSMDWDSMNKQYEADCEYRQSTSWGDIVEESEARTPGRVVHMHEKLSSPSRKSRSESRKRYEDKQAKAQELRQKLQQDKSERLHTLTKKVEEVRAYKDDLLDQRRSTMERKLQRAEQKRQLQLKIKVRKAHEEENKANEIAFINTLEAQNKRHDIFTKYQECEARLQDIQEGRQRRHDEKIAKEAAVEERRRVLQAERQARLADMQKRRRQREEVIEQRQQEKEKERQETARAKDKDREVRIAALNAQQQAHIEELQKKIQIKQVESGRRHKEQLGQISEKALSMTILRFSADDHNEVPKLAPYETQMFCTVCSVRIPSEVHLSSHLRGKKHQQVLSDGNSGKALTQEQIEQFNLKNIVNAPVDKSDPKAASEKERQKAQKKRSKKLRQRMSQRGTEYESSLAGKQQLLESDHKAKLQKIVKDLNKYLQGQDKGPWPQNKVTALDRGLGEVARILEKKTYADSNTFRVTGGLTTLSRILLVIGDCTTDLPPVIPVKSLILCATVFRLACKGCYDNCHYMLFSNKAGSVVDLLNHQLNLLLPDNCVMDLASSGGASCLRLPHDALVTALLQLLTTVLSVLAKHNPTVNSSEASAERMTTSGDPFMSRACDIVSYLISIGILDKLTSYFNNVRGPIDSQPQAAEFLQHSMGLLIAVIRIISKRNVNVFDEPKRDDATQLITTFRVTGLVGIVSLMYGMLLHSGVPPRGESAPPELPAHSLTVATVGFRMLNHLATLDLQLLQGSLGEEGTSLEFRHIASYLLWYCSHWAHEELLHEVILCVGYFTALHPDNQAIIQSGQAPTVLQQLCSLPFQYFSNPRLTSILFPTLITSCYNNQRNRQIVEQELSCALLANFIEAKALEAQTKLSPTMTKKSKTLEKEADLRMAFGFRFPTKEWTTAQDYFTSDK